MTPSIDLVVFDIAGTTVKDQGEITLAFQSAFRKWGYDVPSHVITPLMGYKKTEAIRRVLENFEPDPSRITQLMIDEIHGRFVALMIRFYVTTPALQPLPHAEEVFRELKQLGIRVGLDTGFYNNITDVIVERLGWLKNGLVDYVVSSNQVEAGRPHPYMIQKMMQLAGVEDSRRVVKIGDTESDVQEGQNAGCLYSIAITTGAFTREALEPYHPSFIIDDLCELLSIVQANPAVV